MADAGRVNRGILATCVLVIAAAVAGSIMPEPEGSTSVPVQSTATPDTDDITVQGVNNFSPTSPDFVAPDIKVWQDPQTANPASPDQLDETLPTRPAAILPNPFTYAGDDHRDAGYTELENEPRDLLIRDPHLDCTELTGKFIYSDGDFAACGIGRTGRHEFALVARNASLNATDSLSRSAVKVEAYVHRTSTSGENLAVQVLSGYFTNTLCVTEPSDSGLYVSKAAVGDDVVFIVSQVSISSYTEQITVIAANPEGMPEVVASYMFRSPGFTQGEFVTSVAKRSLVVANIRTDKRNDDLSYFASVRQLFPTEHGWRERLHVSTGDTDPTTKYLDNVPGWIHHDPGLVYPSVMLSYGFPYYDPDRPPDHRCDRYSGGFGGR